jgi:GT2 family glycosyltransferase
MTSISIIVLTYNSEKYISRLLESIKDISKDCEILVADNDSSDGTVKEAKKFNNIKLIQTGANLGFAKGNNFAAKKATGDFLLFLNADTQYSNGKLEDLKTFLEVNERIAVAGGKLINRNGNPEKSAGRFFNIWETFLIILGLDEVMGVRFSSKKIRKVDFVSGGLMMVKKSIFLKLGGFDENFFMYV